MVMNFHVPERVDGDGDGDVMMDAWMREAEDAMTSLEDIESRRTKNVNLGDWGERKVLELWVKLDQLEALLLNPPSKPVLIGEDVESRWDLLLDIRIRTRAVATSLFALPSSRRSDCSDTAYAKEAVKSESHHHVDIPITTSSIKDVPELMIPLISDDATESPLKKRGLQSLAVMSRLSKACWAFCAILGGFAILLTLFILSAAS